MISLQPFNGLYIDISSLPEGYKSQARLEAKRISLAPKRFIYSPITIRVWKFDFNDWFNQKVKSMSTELNDSQRAQLLILYKEKLQSLGDEAFFDQFDSIRRQCYDEIGINLEEIEAQERSNAASKLGKRGGESTSDDKVKAARENGRKGGRKKGDKSINQLGLSLEDI